MKQSFLTVKVSWYYPLWAFALHSLEWKKCKLCKRVAQSSTTPSSKLRKEIIRTLSCSRFTLFLIFGWGITLKQTFTKPLLHCSNICPKSANKFKGKNYSLIFTLLCLEKLQTNFSSGFKKDKKGIYDTTDVATPAKGRGCSPPLSGLRWHLFSVTPALNKASQRSLLNIKSF